MGRLSHLQHNEASTMAAKPKHPSLAEGGLSFYMRRPQTSGCKIRHCRRGWQKGVSERQRRCCMEVWAGSCSVTLDLIKYQQPGRLRHIESGLHAGPNGPTKSLSARPAKRSELPYPSTVVYFYKDVVGSSRLGEGLGGQYHSSAGLGCACSRIRNREKLESHCWSKGSRDTSA